MSLLESVDESRSLQKLLGQRAILGGDFSLDTEIDQVQRVSTEDIARVAGEILTPEHAAVVGLGMREEDLSQALAALNGFAVESGCSSVSKVSA